MRDILEKITLLEQASEAEEFEFRRRKEQEAKNGTTPPPVPPVPPASVKDSGDPNDPSSSNYTNQADRASDIASSKGKTSDQVKVRPANPNVLALQKELKDAGADLGKFGPKGDGLDGQWGKITAGAAFSDPKFTEIAKKYADKIPQVASILKTKEFAQGITAQYEKPNYSLGKPGSTTPDGPQSSAQANTVSPAAPEAPAAGPANAKEQNYQIALKQIKDLYAKSQVPYPPTDKILQSRYGLPDPLPPLDQWDGTMPKSTGADFLTRNLFGRQASADTAKQQGVNDLSNAGNAKADAAVAADMAKLTDLVGKLKALSATPAPAQGAKPAAATPAVPGVKAGGQVVDTRGGIGGVDEMEESTTYFLNKLRMLEADAPAAGGDKASIIKQIQDIMADINAQNENPPQDVIKALSDAQAAIDTANKPTGSAALDGTKPGADPATTIPGGPATAAGGAGVVPPVKPATPTGQGAKPLAPGQKPLPAGVKPSTAGAGRGGQGGPTAAQAATAKPAAPAPAPATGSKWNPMNWFKEGEMTEQELVKFKDDQTLARIVDITRR